VTFLEWNNGMLELWSGAEEKGGKEFLVLIAAVDSRWVPGWNIGTMEWWNDALSRPGAKFYP
jgi:hypothetical protein